MAAIIEDTIPPPDAALDRSSNLSTSPARADPRVSADLIPRTEADEFLGGLLCALLSSDGTLPCPLPSAFAAGLLRVDEEEEQLEATMANAGRVDVLLAEGVPAYPLYKHLARALSECVGTGAFPRTWEAMPGIAETGEAKKQKLDEWTLKVVELGSKLLELRQAVKLQLHVQQPYFSQLKDGSKTVEGRCASRAYNELRAGDLLLFNESLLLRVEDVHRYSTFHEMLEEEGLSNVLPGVTSISEGVQVYRAFYSEAQERAGVLGIHVGRPQSLRQPFQILHDLLNELQVEGVRSLLGMRSTMGSIDDALPPPASALLSSFASVQHETLPGSKLTVGARALAKHVHRSSDGWWGVCTGSEPTKNDVAMRKIQGMIHQAVWLNVHKVPVPVFELRVRDGYGARWSAAGSQFRGFLEPPMDEGYLHKWRH